MNNIKIYLILTGIMFSWGMNVTAIKTLVRYFPVITIQSLRVFFAGVVVFLILALLKKIRKPSGSEYVYIVAGGLLNVTSHHLFLGMGLSETSAVNGGLILGLGPLLTALMAILFLGNRLTCIRSMGFLFGTVGILLTVLGGGKGLSGISIGDFYIFISIFTQAASFILISKAARTMDPRLLTGYMLVFGSIVLLFIGLWLEPEGLHSIRIGSILLWSLFLGSAIVATAIGHMLYNYAVGKVGPAETSIFLNLNTFFSLVGAVVFLGEEMTVYHLFGLVFIVAGVLFGSGALEELTLKRKSVRRAA